MELRISAKNLTLPDRFREHVTKKSGKVSELSHGIQEFAVKVTRHEHSSAGVEDQVELAVYLPGQAIKAEARASDNFAAFDMAFGKLLERLRRDADKHKVHRGGGHKNLGVSELTAADFAQIDLKPMDVFAPELPKAPEPEPKPKLGKSPVIIRTKEFQAESMTRDQAVTRMELVGHDFYLFIDSSNNQPSVVYKRKGWTYGVISLA